MLAGSNWDAWPLAVRPFSRLTLVIMSVKRSFSQRVLVTVGIVAASLLVLYLFVVLSRVLLIVFGLVQTLESYVITPLVQQRAVSLPPVILITAQIAMGVIAGAVGVLLAAPLAIFIIVLL